MLHRGIRGQGVGRRESTKWEGDAEAEKLVKSETW